MHANDSRSVVIATLFTLTLLAGCAMSPTYGEKDLRSYEKDFKTSNPISPKYRVENLGGALYSLTVHQGSALFSPGYVRHEYLSQAALVIANDTCNQSGMAVGQTEFKGSGDSGWVHLQGTFSCLQAHAAAPSTTSRPAQASTGTGFFVSKIGHVVTAFHVVEGATKLVVRTESGSIYEATIMRSDPANDLAVLKLDLSDTRPILLESSRETRKGDEVLALGYPLLGLQGQEQKATFGHVNALSGPVGDVRFLQIDAAIQPGNSGGPLLNSAGRVIGVVSATLSQRAVLNASGTLAQGVNYAVKSDYLLPLLPHVNTTSAQAASKSSGSTWPELIRGVEESVVLIVAEQ